MELIALDKSASYPALRAPGFGVETVDLPSPACPSPTSLGALASLLDIPLTTLPLFTASPLSLPPSLSPSTLLILSSSLSSSTTTFSLPDPLDPSSTLNLTSQDLTTLVQQLESEGVGRKEVEFADKGAAGAELESAPAPAPKAVKSTTAPTGATAAKEAAALAAKKELEGKSGVQLGLTVKKDQAVFGEWYSQVLIKGEMLDYYDISGCYILKPWSYGIWQEIQAWFDKGM